MNYSLKFLSHAHRHPRSTGAILPSSRELALNVLEPVDFSKASTIVELGPGIGPITAEIAARLSGGTTYIGIEKNRDFCETLRTRFPSLQFFHDCAENTPAILQKAAISGGADAIISSLPWVLFPVEQWPLMLDAIKRAMKPGGVFITYVYVSGLLFPSAHAFRRRLEAEFGAVETTPIVWFNIPPAFAYVCRK